MENNKKVPTYEVKYIETKEQEQQQKLTIEQEQELIENSYHLENEVWSDISASKGYGPTRGPTNRCGSYPMNMENIRAGRDWYVVAGVRANGTWCCDFHRSRGIDYNQRRSSSYTPPKQYSCSHSGCSNSVNTRGGYCPQHQPR